MFKCSDLYSYMMESKVAIIEATPATIVAPTCNRPPVPPAIMEMTKPRVGRSRRGVVGSGNCCIKTKHGVRYDVVEVQAEHEHEHERPDQPALAAVVHTYLCSDTLSLLVIRTKLGSGGRSQWCGRGQHGNANISLSSGSCFLALDCGLLHVLIANESVSSDQY